MTEQVTREQAEGAPRSGRAPGGWPGLGHVPALLRHPLRLLESAAAHGDLVEIRLGLRPAFLLCHPDLARQVLTDFRNFDRVGPLYERQRRAIGNGIALAARQEHRRQRLMLQPAFRREYMHGYVAVMQDAITATTSGWPAGPPVDLVQEMFRLTAGIALRALFTSRLSVGETEKLRVSLDVFLRGCYFRALLPVPPNAPLPGNLRYSRALNHWRGQVERLIGDSRLGADGDDLMSRLIRATDEGGAGLSDRELSDQVAILLLAGGETTAAAVVWALHLLHSHPQVLAALRLEADAVAGDGIAGWDALPRLELTARVVRETLRLYPPGWVIPRVTTGEVTLAGRELPAASMVLFSPYILHRRADLFRQPDQFDPDRWLPGRLDAEATRRGSFLPFGTGAAKCIGEDFALAETALIVSEIVRQWNFALKPGFTVSAKARAVLTPKKFPVCLTRRIPATRPHANPDE